MGAPDPAIERALDHAKHHWKSPQVLIGYVATLLGIIGAILYWTTKGSSWVSGTYFILVPLIPTLAALFGIHILHLWAMFLIWTFAGLEGSVYVFFKANTEITMAIGIQLAIIAGAFTVAIIHQIWSGAAKVVDQIKSPFGILAAVAWLVVVIGSIVLQTQGGSNLTLTVPAVWLATMFLIGQLIPVAGLNAALAVAIPAVYNMFIITTCGSTNVTQAGAAVVAAGLTIIILLLVITDYLRHHKPEDLAPEIRAKIASITTSVPLASALLWFIVAIAGYIVFIVGSTGKISCSSNYANFTVILACLFNFLGNLLDVWRFHYIAFGWFLPIFPALCSTLHVTSTSNSVYVAYILLAIAALGSMLSFNFIDTFKQVPKEVKNVSPPQFVQLAAAILYLIGSVLIFFVKNMIISTTVFPLGLSGLYLMIFAIVIVFFDTSNLEFLTMAMVGLTSYSALTVADGSSDDLLTAGAVFIYIGTVVQAVALALQPPAAGKGKNATAGEASSLL